MEHERGEDQRPFILSRLAESEEYRAEVEAAERLGISLKRFRGWEPTTRYTYRGGHVVSSRPESEWDEQSQAEMLALAAYRAGLCPNCNGRLEETTAAENEDRYAAELPLQCHRCKAFAMVHDKYQGEHHSHTYLHLVRLRPKRG